MKTARIFLSFVMMTLTAMTLSCSPEDGKNGIDGMDGMDGEQGPPGEDGNANVTIYAFPGHDFSSDGSIQNELSGLSDAVEMNNSVWICYLGHSNGAWYHIPGLGHSGASEYRASHRWDDANSTADFTIIKQTGPGETYSDILVVRIESSGIEPGAKSQVSPEPLIPDELDISDLTTVMKYYDLNKEDMVHTSVKAENQIDLPEFRIN